MGFILTTNRSADRIAYGEGREERLRNRLVVADDVEATSYWDIAFVKSRGQKLLT